MIGSEFFLQQAQEAGFRLFSGVPCSYLNPLINGTISSPGLRYVAAANEGDAVAVASGAELAGRRGVALFQNSGLGNAVNPLTSLNATFRIPVLLIATWRGEPGGGPDEPQHELMGRVTPELFDVLRVRWEFFPDTEAAVGPALRRAVQHMEEERLPYALLMKKGAVADQALRQTEAPRPPAGPPPDRPAWPARRPTRREVLGRVQAAARPADAVLATTGYTGRELYALGDRPNQLYLVGSMGCVASLGLGLALAQPRRRVVVLDGDGAALMRLGALATIGRQRPSNLVHVLLDNEVYDSTGGQATVSHATDLAAVAWACGYPRVLRAGSPDEVADAQGAAGEGLTFVHVKIRTEELLKLPRPTVTPPQVAARFRAWLRETELP
jgi:phosphonopyruvate decarboxylase